MSERERETDRERDREICSDLPAAVSLHSEKLCAFMHETQQHNFIDYLNHQQADRISKDLMLIMLFSSTHPIGQLLHTQSRFILFGVKQSSS